MTDWIWIIVGLLVIAAGACWQAMSVVGRLKTRPRASLRARRVEAYRRRDDAGDEAGPPAAEPPREDRDEL